MYVHVSNATTDYLYTSELSKACAGMLVVDSSCQPYFLLMLCFSICNIDKLR